MASLRRLNRSNLLKLSAATVSATMLLSAKVYADAPLFDNMSPWAEGVGTLPSDYAFYYYAQNLADTPPDSPTAGTMEGEAYTLPAGTTSLTGIDLTFANSTNSTAFQMSSTATSFNNGNGLNFANFEITVSIWGSVTPSPALNASNPVLSSTNRAFSNLLGTYTFSNLGSLPVSPYIYYFENQAAPAALPSLSFPALNVSGYSTVGVSYNLEGSLDGTTYQQYPGLTPIFEADIPPIVGSQQTNAVYVNLSGESDGNYNEGPFTFQSNSSGTFVNIPYQGVGARLYGNAPGQTYLWTNPGGGVFTDNTQWNPQNVPGGNDTAIFNLSSSSPYVVEIPGVQPVGSFVVQNDNVQIDLDAQDSYLYASNVLSVGNSPTAHTATNGTLSFINTGGIYLGETEAANVVIGGNGGTGSVSVTSGVYFVSDGDTYIGPGSNLSVSSFAKFETGTLTLAGTTNAWTGQLDIGPTAVDIFNGSIGTVMNQLKTGYNNGKWNGQGIISSTAAADSTHLTAVGAIVNNDGNGNPLYGSGTALGLFDGEAPPVNAVLVRYTYYGDANLDGKVDGSDYSAIDNGALLHLTGWQNGDFNYDGVINGSDYTLIDNAYNTQGAAIPFQNIFDTPGSDVVGPDVADTDSNGLRLTDGSESSSLRLSEEADAVAYEGTAIATTTAEIAVTTPVPEPASLGMLALASASLLRRRSRRARGTS